MKELLLLACCILFYGVAAFLKRLGLLQLHPFQFLLLASICYASTIPGWIVLASKENIESFTYPNILLVVGYSFCSLGAGLILAFLLRNAAAPSALLVLINLSSIITLLLSYVLLHEHLSTSKVIAIILALISLLLMNY